MSAGIGFALFAYCFFSGLVFCAPYCISRTQTKFWNIVSVQVFFPVYSHTKNPKKQFFRNTLFANQSLTPGDTKTQKE